MDAPQILATLQHMGLTVTPAGAGNVRVTPKKAITDEARALIRAHKAELLAALGAAPDPVTEARRHRVTELAGHLRLYADRNGFTQADFDEALQVAVAGDLEGWLAYIKGQNETRH